MKDFIKKNKFALIAIIPGAILGYLYWFHIGCNSGTCPITAVWHNSALFGAVSGYLIGNIFDDRKKESDARKERVEEKSS